jgi:hypothetical protein
MFGVERREEKDKRRGLRFKEEKGFEEKKR